MGSNGLIAAIPEYYSFQVRVLSAYSVLTTVPRIDQKPCNAWLKCYSSCMYISKFDILKLHGVQLFIKTLHE